MAKEEGESLYNFAKSYSSKGPCLEIGSYWVELVMVCIS